MAIHQNHVSDYVHIHHTGCPGVPFGIILTFDLRLVQYYGPIYTY